MWGAPIKAPLDNFPSVLGSLFLPGKLRVGAELCAHAPCDLHVWVSVPLKACSPISHHIINLFMYQTPNLCQFCIIWSLFSISTWHWILFILGTHLVLVTSPEILSVRNWSLQLHYCPQMMLGSSEMLKLNLSVKTVYSIKKYCHINV